MRLSELLKGDNGPPSGLARDVEVTGLSADSRTVRPGNLFVALEGPRFDGHDYVADAMERGPGERSSTGGNGSREKP